MLGIFKRPSQWPRALSVVFFLLGIHAWQRWQTEQLPVELGYLIGMLLLGLAVALGFLSLPHTPPETSGRRQWMLVTGTGLLGVLMVLVSSVVKLLV